MPCLLVFNVHFFMVAYGEKRLLSSLLFYSLLICSRLCPLFRVDYAKTRQFCSRLCSFLLLLMLAWSSFYMRFFSLYGSVSAPYSSFRSRALVSKHSRLACNSMFYIVARHHKLFPENLPRDRRFLRRVLRHTAYALSENQKIKVLLFVELASETNGKER